MVEVKADALEDSFDAIEQEEDGVAALKAELEALKSRIATGTIAAQRPALDGVKSAEAASRSSAHGRRRLRRRLEDRRWTVRRGLRSARSWLRYATMG